MKLNIQSKIVMQRAVYRLIKVLMVVHSLLVKKTDPGIQGFTLLPKNQLSQSLMVKLLHIGSVRKHWKRNCNQCHTPTVSFYSVIITNPRSEMFLIFILFTCILIQFRLTSFCPNFLHLKEMLQREKSFPRQG